MPNNSSTIYLRGIPRADKDHFKAHCAKRGKNMTQVIIEFIHDTVRKAKRNEKEIQWVKGG